jgi:hypothetical protein
MNAIANLIPMSADDMQRRRGVPGLGVNSKWVGRSLANTASPQIQPPQVTRPVPNYQPTQNLTEAPYRGWSMDALNTYIIPPHDQQQLALFSKYILRDPNAKPYNDLVSRAMQNVQRRQNMIQKAHNQRPDLKQAYRSSVQGSTNMNPTVTQDVGPTYYAFPSSRNTEPTVTFDE